MTEARKFVVVGWSLDRAQRERLLEHFPPAYPDVVADHVTLAAGVSEDAAPPPDTAAEIVGRTDDGAGVQALVVRIDGATARPGGGVYHLTWSLDRARGRRAVESNRAIAERGWEPLAEPVPIRLTSARFVSNRRSSAP